MATTTNGIIYPTSGDNIAPLETHFANLANSADDAIAAVEALIDTPVVSGSTSFTGPAASSSSVSVPVTFASALDSVPVVVATVQGSGSASTYVVTIAGTPTINGFTAKVWRVDGSTAETDLKLNWIAKV